MAAAKELKFAPFNAAVAYWTQLADPDGAEESDMEKMARRDVYVSQSVGGMWLGKMTLDPIGGAIYAGELVRLEAEMFDADWAEAKARLGRDPHLDELARTPAQRRADAAVEMAVRSKAMPENARRPEPLFSVLVDFPTLAGRICELANGGIRLPGLAGALARPGLLRTDRLCPGQAGRVLGHGPLFHRGDPPGHRSARPVLHPPLLRGPRRTLPDRPHHPLQPRGRDHPGERAGLLRLPQPAAERRTRSGGLGGRRGPKTSVPSLSSGSDP